MKFSLLLIVIVFTVGSLSCQSKPPSSEINRPKKDWWENAVFYQIYPRSFKDSDGDGIGDLKGITEKLDHLKNIGVTATWLSPIFKSPMVDFGYDISNFYDIQPEYGTMKDFENLLIKAKQLGIKVILDFVPNHSSDENEWFKKSINRERGYEDFYVWHDGYPDPNNLSDRLPPSNWISNFRGSAWEWNDVRKQFYLHQFAKQQPDLNYRNSLVREQMKHVLSFWLDKGVDGFRVDAVPWCFEVEKNETGDYPDEPKSGNTNDTQNEAYLRHIYTQDQPETIDLVYDWRKLLTDYARIHNVDTKVLLIESWSPLSYTLKFYGNNQVDGAQIPFNFKLIEDSKLDVNAADLVNIVNSWWKQMPSKRVANWVLGNHDKRRVSTRYGKERIDIMEMLQMLLPGVGITYMGEEIGMLDGNITWEQTKDPAALNSNRNIYMQFSRDPERTPFQWNNSTSAGFLTNTTTWLPVESHYKEINVEKELADDRSHLKVYMSLVKLRQTDTLKYGGMIIKSIKNDSILVLERQLQNQPSYILVTNIKSDNQNAVNLGDFRPGLPEKLTVAIASVSSKRNIGESVSASSLTLNGYESLILST